MSDDLIYMRNRFYAPSTGRFMHDDPIGLTGGNVSFYRYMANDPINFVDPLGLLTFGIDYSITGGDGSAATGGTTYVIDSQGNYGIVEYAGAGGYFGAGGSVLGRRKKILIQYISPANIINMLIPLRSYKTNTHRVFWTTEQILLSASIRWI